MVTLSTAYGLCSLIEQGSFVSACEDDEGCALVTLGKNIAIRYRLVDQKQLNSWSTIPRFTSKVVYNPYKSEYLAIFNETIVKRWQLSDNNLEKVSKMKLTEPGHSILLDGEEPVVLFKSGACCRVSYLTDKSNAPAKGFLGDETRITSARIFNSNNQKYLVLITCVGDSKMMSHCVPLSPSGLVLDLTAVRTLKIRRRAHEVIASCFITRDSGEALVTSWSDGFIFLLALPWAPTEASVGQFSGVVRTVSATTAASASMTALSSNHVAVYGADPADEGAVLAIYNLDFGIVQASTTFKLLHKPPQLWAVHNRLLLGFGQRLLCVPYALQTGSVSALVGSRTLTTDTPSCDVMAVVPSVSWEKESKKSSSHVETDRSSESGDVRNEVEGLSSQGLSESGICEALLSQYLEKEDIGKLCWCLDHFLDIPEPLTVRLLHFAFSSPDHKFQGAPNTHVTQPSPRKNENTQRCPNTPDKACPSPNLPRVNPEPVNGISPKNKKKKTRKSSNVSSPVVNGHSEVNGTEEVMEVTSASPVATDRAAFIDRVLRVPSNKAALIPALRSGFSTTDCINILQYLSHQLSTGKLEDSSVEWLTTVIDAFYQQLLLGRHSECVEAVLRLKTSVSDQVEALQELREVLPRVVRLKNKKNASRNSLQLKSYSIQELQIYQ